MGKKHASKAWRRTEKAPAQKLQEDGSWHIAGFFFCFLFWRPLEH
jgi:hypothetical protein